MINETFINYDLEFNGFTIQFEINIEFSIEDTDGFSNSQYPDFIFARGAIWLCVGNEKSILFDYQDSGNILAVLDGFERVLIKVPKIKNLESIVICGELRAWSEGYFQRIRDDTSLENDEATYELLSPSILDTAHMGKFGEYYVYSYDNKNIIEVNLREHENFTHKPAHVWAEFDPMKMSQKVKLIREEIGVAISKAIEAKKNR
jgi:hypothetical protein